MREQIIVDGVKCVRRGHNFVTKATDALLQNIERSIQRNKVSDGPEVVIIRRDLLRRVREYTKS